MITSPHKVSTKILVGLLGLVVLIASAIYWYPPGESPDAPGVFLSPPHQYLRDVNQSEALAKQFQQSLQTVLVAKNSNENVGVDRRLFHPEFLAEWGKVHHFQDLSEDGNTLKRLTPTDERVRCNAQTLLELLKERSTGLATRERSGVHLFRNLISIDQKHAYVEAHVELGGIYSKNHALFEWRGTITASFKNSPVQGWQLARLREHESTLSIIPKANFVDVSQQTGLVMFDSSENRKNAQAIINARKMPSSGGISITDFNADRAPDVLVSRKGRGVTLFLNDKKGGFQPIALKAFENAADAAKFYLWVDLNNDGQDELVSTKFTRDAKNRFAMTLYRRQRDELKKDIESLRFEDEAWLRDLDFQGIVSCDVDNNGFLDLIFVGYTHLESGLQQTNFVKGTDGARNLLFLNHGDFKFSEEGRQRGLKDTSYSFVAECHDFDRDGDVDLFVGNDYGQNNLYQNDGKAYFHDDVTHPFHRGRGFSMGISMADFDNTGHYAVSLSNMYSHAGNRIVPLADNLSDEMRQILEGYAAGNSLFEQKDGSWQETAVRRQVEYAQWAWGNVFFDFDNDRDQDLYVVNGFTSHEDPKAPDF